MANQSAKKKKRRSAWRPARSMGPLPAAIALIGAVAMLLTWLLQSSPLFTLRASADNRAGGLRISEVMSANASTRVGNGSGIEDWIELQNASDRAIDLTGCALVRQTRPAQAFTFSGGTLQPGEYVLVHADGSGQPRQSDRKSTRLNSSHPTTSRMPSSA